jgi:hypothetical protein
MAQTQGKQRLGSRVTESWLPRSRVTRRGVRPAEVTAATDAPRFASFWQAGFESATHRNARGARVDMVAATQHLEQADEDYARLRTMDIRVAREGVRWHLVEQGERFEFSSLEPLVAAAARHGIQIIWTLCHYGWPDDLDVFAPEFVRRFARYSTATAQFIATAGDAIPIYCPINEISFLAFAAGETGEVYPFVLNRGDELKAQLVRASIAGIEAIWSVDARARIVQVDPLVNLVPPLDRPDLADLTAGQHASQFAAWDWLAGRSRPELGGHPRYLDVIGVNYYHNNQWEFPVTREHMVHLRWDDEPRDPRWVPFHRLLAAAHARYHRPIFVAETSHFGVGRARWITEMAQEVARACAVGVPVAGMCLYPILDRPDWNDPDHWHNSGLWDLEPDGAGRLRRVLVEDYAAALAAARARVGDGCPE